MSCPQPKSSGWDQNGKTLESRDTGETGESRRDTGETGESRDTGNMKETVESRQPA